MAGGTSCRTLVAQWWLLVSLATGVSAADSSLVGLVAAGSISVVFLVAIIFYIAVSFSWSELYSNWMHNKGKVRMPKAYWKKKEEAKKRLLSASASHGTASVVNGHPPAQSVDRAPENDKAASWVQGWNQRTSQFPDKVYEEKDVTMELGEEHDDEFRIETELTDNEVLDVGPFKNDHSNERAIDGDIYPEPYIYTTVDNSSRRQADTVAGTTVTTTVTSTTVHATGGATEMQEISIGESGVPEGPPVTNYDDMLVQL